uniref:Uncharacterized protein n=1 Tax=Rhizophora mucronata TaxID=61149 RepID=A0A2P2PD88_RHIMU
MRTASQNMRDFCRTNSPAGSLD